MDTFPARRKISVPWEVSRRSLICGGVVAAGALAGCYPLTSAWAFKRYYKYRVRLEVDGELLEFSNGGVVAGVRGWTGGGGYVRDFPTPSAMRLKSGELLLVQPPSMTIAIEHALPSVNQYEKIVKAPYVEGQRPSVFFLSDGKSPNRIDAYVMAAAQTGDGVRVKFLSIENELIDEDQRKSIIEMVPWLGPAEALREARLRRGEAGYWADTSDVLREYPQALVQSGTLKGQLEPLLFASFGTIRRRNEIVEVGEPLNVQINGPTYKTEYAALTDALRRGERVDVPLVRKEVAGRYELRWPEEPRVVTFSPVSDAEIKWAQQRPYDNQKRDDRITFMHLLTSSFSAPPLGSLEFVKAPKSTATWFSQDQLFELIVRHLQLDLYNNTAAGASGTSIGLSHSIVI